MERLSKADIRVKPLDEALSEKQDRFIDYWFELGNATDAAIKAGYSKKTATRIGYENLIKLDLHIQARAAEKPQSSQNRIAAADEVLEYLTSAMRGEIKEEVVCTVSLGEGMGSAVQHTEKQITPRDRGKAAELLGKRYRLYVDKIEEKVDKEIRIVLEGDAAEWSK